jgi:hypothetical protein
LITEVKKLCGPHSLPNIYIRSVEFWGSRSPKTIHWKPNSDASFKESKGIINGEVSASSQTAYRSHQAEVKRKTNEKRLSTHDITGGITRL